MMKLGLAACAALALTATSASANGYWQNGIYYTYPTTTTQTYTAPSYTGTTGSVGPVELSGTVTYVQPYTVPSYTVPSPYVAPSYGTPSYGFPSYAPSYAPLPQYDGRDQVRKRLKRQRDRIERALQRGDLRRGEERRLRESLREIRRTFRAYRDNDGHIGRFEQAALMRMLDENSRRIRRLANNDRVAGHRGGHHGSHGH